MRYNALTVVREVRAPPQDEVHHVPGTDQTKTHRLRLGPRSAGVLLTTEEFDRARFVEGWRYELINEVLVVSPNSLP